MKKVNIAITWLPEAHSGPRQASKIEPYAKTVDNLSH